MSDEDSWDANCVEVLPLSMQIQTPSVSASVSFNLGSLFWAKGGRAVLLFSAPLDGSLCFPGSDGLG